MKTRLLKKVRKRFEILKIANPPLHPNEEVFGVHDNKTGKNLFAYSYKEAYDLLCARIRAAYAYKYKNTKVIKVWYNEKSM